MFEGRFGKIKFTEIVRIVKLEKSIYQEFVVRGWEGKGSLIMPGCLGF